MYVPQDGNASNLAETLLSQSSGKMVLVDKLLPKLKEAGRRVLIFSQVCTGCSYWVLPWLIITFLSDAMSLSLL